MNRADQLVQIYNIDLALIIHKNGKYYTYQSIVQGFWPYTITDIIDIYNTNNE